MKNVYRKLFTLICTMLVLIPVLAQEVDEATAQQRALNFLQKSLSKSKSKNGKTPAMNVTLAHTSKGDMGNNYYAYNIGKNEGFVLVSADEKAKEILAYSDYGSFAYTTIPSNVKWWLSQYDNQIANLRKSMQADTTRCANSHVVSFKNNGSSGAIISKNIANQAKYAPNHVAEISEADRQDITPMISTKWDQGYPYNSMIPILGAEYTGDNGLATGCVATAIAQILNYYKYPTAEKGHGSNTYTKTFPEIGNTTLTFEADFANTTYDWDNMLNTYDGSESQASKDAVAKLMYHVGVANNMDYGLLPAGGSGSIIQNIPHALVDYLGIDKSTTCEDRSCYTNAAWEGLVYSELCQNRPILYSGVTYANEGHTFLCDGYSASDNHYHINWGWGGMCDGYYVLTATENEIPLQPSLSGVGGAGNGASYSAMQYIEKNFIPDQGGDYVCCIRNVGGYQIDKLSAKNGEVITVNGNIFNLSLVEKQITLGVRLMNIYSGENVYYEIAKDVNLTPNQGFSSFQFSISNLADGKYAIYPAYYESSKPGEWNDVLSASSAPVLNVGVDVTVESVDKSRLYLKCDALSILEPTELVGTSVSETKEYILNGGSVPMIKIQGCVYADNCINEATLDYGFGIFKDGTLIATEVLRQYFGEGSSYFIYSPLYGYLDAPGTYKIKMIYRYQNEETYHYCYGANLGYVEILNDGTKLTASLRVENDLSDPNICMTNDATFIIGDDTQERNPETGCFDVLINQVYSNKTSDIYYFDMGLALLKNGDIIKTYPIFESNTTAPGWGWTRYGYINLDSDIPDGIYQLAGISKLYGIDTWKIGNYIGTNGPIEIEIRNNVLSAIDSFGHGKDSNPPVCMTLEVSDYDKTVGRSNDGNFYINMMLALRNKNENYYFFDFDVSLYNEQNEEVLCLDYNFMGRDYGLYSHYGDGAEHYFSNSPKTYSIPQGIADGIYTIQAKCKYVNSKKYPDWRICPNTNGEKYQIEIKNNSLTMETIGLMVSEIRLNKNHIKAFKDDTFYLSAMCLPNNAISKNVIWSSDNTNIATISENGEIHAISEGVANIYATAADGGGAIASCKVEVLSREHYVKISISKSGYGTINVNEESTNEWDDSFIVAKGTNPVMTFMPAPCLSMVSARVNGRFISNPTETSTYTVENIQEDYQLQIDFGLCYNGGYYNLGGSEVAGDQTIYTYYNAALVEGQGYSGDFVIPQKIELQHENVNFDNCRVKVITGSAFDNEMCSNLHSIDIPVTIDDFFPNSLRNNYYKYLIVHWDTPFDIGTTAFYQDWDNDKTSLFEHVTLMVPVGTLEKYRNHAVWGLFKNIVEGDDWKTYEQTRSYTLTYVVDGDVYKTVEYTVGATITPEPAPTKTGYTFSGWSEIPEVMPDHDVTITGSFSINPSAIITPGVSDGTEITDQNVNSIMEFSLTLNNVESVVINTTASVQLYVAGILKGIASIGDIIVNNGTITIKFSPVQSSSSKGMVRDFWHAVKATASDDVDVLVKIAANSFTLNGETIADEISYNYKAKASVAEQIDLALAIDDLKATSTSDEPVYNLNGIRVNGKVRKGIVIKSGKKYLVK